MNIKEYKFTDYSLDVVEANEVAISFNTKDMPWIAIYPVDVIEMVKHFNITKQIELALLNSLIADFVKGSVPFEDVVASRLNSLELEND